MSRIICFVINNKPSFLKMTRNAIQMIRKHSDIPIRAFLVSNSFCEEARKCRALRDLDVEIICKPSVDDYHCANRCYVAECKEDSVLSLDSDVLVFDNIEKVFDAHADADITACQSHWIKNYDWKPEFIPEVEMPFNSGVVLCNHGTAQRWGSRIVELCKELRERKKYPELSQWLWDHSYGSWQEETALSLFVAEDGCKYEYFNDSECRLPRVSYRFSIHSMHQSIIFHTYSRYWKSFYRELKRKKHLKLIKTDNIGW